MSEKNPLSSAFGWLKDPKKNLFRLLSVYTVGCGYMFFWVYQEIFCIHIDLISLESLLDIGWISLIVLPLTYFGYVKSDPLQHSHSRNRWVKFYQSNFSSWYLIERCDNCKNKQNNCKNVLTAQNYHFVWFRKLFNGKILEDDPDMVKRTFLRGYICKYIYGVQVVSLVLFILSFLCLGYQFFLRDSRQFFFQAPIGYILFPAAMIIIPAFLYYFNKPNMVSPTGCWHAWRQIGQMMRDWLKRNEDYLIEAVCEYNKTNFRYIPLR